MEPCNHSNTAKPKEKKKPDINLLVLQGGGARGAYEVGVYQAMVEYGYAPHWVSGISSGAINAAIIAGNRPENRLPKLQEFWSLMADPFDMSSFLPKGISDIAKISSALGTMLGKVNFYQPHALPPFMVPPGTSAATSLYDQKPLEQTLRKVINFNEINGIAKNRIRLTIGATQVCEGNLHFFDSKREAIYAEHLMAASAMPPGASAVEVDGELYWDGGIVANTPLEGITGEISDIINNHNRVFIFLVDLWPHKGDRPRDLASALWRKTQIEFSNRLADSIQLFIYHIDEMAQKYLKEGQIAVTAGKINIIRLIHDRSVGPDPFDPIDFTSSSIQARIDLGYKETSEVLQYGIWTSDDAGAPTTHISVYHSGKITKD